MSVLKALGSGFLGAVALTAVHQAAQKVTPDAPRMDVLGKIVLARASRRAGAEPPDSRRLFTMAMAGDIISNGLYYAMVGFGRPEGALLRGAALGAAAGAGGVALPGRIGLPTAPSARKADTAAMTVAWYLLGGLAAGAIYRALEGGSSQE
jgi:hypothetical protein